MNKTTKFPALASALVGGILSASALAQNPGYEFGDLIVGIQATGAGSDRFVLANLGNAGVLRDAAGSLLNIIDVGAVLTTQFGTNWFNRTDLFFGAATVGSNDEFNGFFVNGDPDLTVYASAPRQSVGSAGVAASGGYTLNPNGGVQSAANGIFGSVNSFETLASSNFALIARDANFVDWNDQNPANGLAFNEFASGVQVPFGNGIFGVLGGVNAEAAVDLYRIQGFNNIPGQFGFGEPTAVGTFEGTVVIDNAGSISLVVPEPSTALLIGVGLAGLASRRRRVA